MKSVIIQNKEKRFKIETISQSIRKVMVFHRRRKIVYLPSYGTSATFCRLCKLLIYRDIYLKKTLRRIKYTTTATSSRQTMETF